MLDTYYHIDIEAAYRENAPFDRGHQSGGIASRRTGSQTSPPLENGSAALIATALTKEEARIAQNNSMLLSPLAKGAYVPGTEEFDNLFQLSPTGWHDFENWGVWSRGDKSEIVLRPQPR